MTRLCVLCSQIQAEHPEVGGGYLPHPFEPAERRKLVRRMDDVDQRIATILDLHRFRPWHQR
jgi:hypothetical protein